MNGAAVLTRAREIASDVTRILLTGQADTSSRSARSTTARSFASSPSRAIATYWSTRCTPRCASYELVTAEKVLRPADAARRGRRPRRRARARIAARVRSRDSREEARRSYSPKRSELPDPWQLELAVSLQALGYVSLTPETLEKLYAGHAARATTKQRQVARMPEVTEQILAHIPRLEQIREILTVAARQAAWSGVAGRRSDRARGCDPPPRERRRCDRDQRHSSARRWSSSLRKRGGHAPTVVDALETLVGHETSRQYIVELSLIGVEGRHGGRRGHLPQRRAARVARLLGDRKLSRARSATSPVGAVKEPIRILMTTECRGGSSVQVGYPNDGNESQRSDQFVVWPAPCFGTRVIAYPRGVRRSVRPRLTVDLRKLADPCRVIRCGRPRSADRGWPTSRNVIHT